ncbi:MAG: hypothetical protein ABI639_11195 [Thermoanaerobaculia bacterium]
MKLSIRQVATALAMGGAALFTLAPRAEAQTPFPVGPQALANVATPGDQDESAVAMDGNGNYVVVWRDEFGDSNLSAIVGRRFSFRTGLPLSPAFVVNSTAAGDQRHPVIAMRADGRFLVAWEGPDSTGPATTGIFARIFRPDTTEFAAEFSVNAVHPGVQKNPAVAMQPDGSFLIAWQDTVLPTLSAPVFPELGSVDSNIVGRLYPSTYPSNPPTGAFLINTGLQAGEQENPVLAPIFSTGGWFAAWQGPTGPPVFPAIFLRLLNGGGGGDAEFPVNTTFSSSARSNPALSTNASGDAVVVWQDELARSIFAREILAGNPQQTEIQVNVSPDHLNREPGVALDKFGNYVTVWVEAVGAFGATRANEAGGESTATEISPEGSPIVLQGRKKNASGGFSEFLPPPADTQFPVNSGGADFARPRVVGDSHGSFVAVWQGTDSADPSGRGIAYRAFLDAVFTGDFETGNLLPWSSVVP